MNCWLKMSPPLLPLLPLTVMVVMEDQVWIKCAAAPRIVKGKRGERRTALAVVLTMMTMVIGPHARFENEATTRMTSSRKTQRKRKKRMKMV